MMRTIAALLLALLSLETQGVERVVYYHNDALGSPIAATDAQGRVVWRKSYTPYGQPIDQAAPNEPGYTGKFEEPGLGIQNFGARWYDPRIGRFLAIDPAGFDPRNPQSFNRYAYANNNPYKYVDPDGRAPKVPYQLNFDLGTGGGSYGMGYGRTSRAQAPPRATGEGVTAGGGNRGTVPSSEVANSASKSRALNSYDPPNDGFLGAGRDFTLIPGARVDRYGRDAGRFLAPEGTPIPMRALPPGTTDRTYSIFEVTKPLQVKAGEIAPAYAQPGHGTQFVTDQAIRDLIGGGYLKRDQP
ncbi:MAG: glycohydrolase toxin TNT-related protein [Gammaproteobacteria bacterium]